MDADEWIQRQAFSHNPQACQYKRMLTILPITTKCDTDCANPVTLSPTSLGTPRDSRRRSSVTNFFAKLGGRNPRPI